MVIRGKQNRAFTLLELVLVLMVIGIVMALVVPSLKGWSKGSRLRDAGDQFLAMARFARAQAVGNAQVYRLNVDAGEGRYWVMVQDGQQFASLGTEFGRAFALPEGLSITMTDEQSMPLEFVDFYPTGRARAANVRISANENDFVDIVCPSPAEGFRLATPSEAKQ